MKVQEQKMNATKEETKNNQPTDEEKKKVEIEEIKEPELSPEEKEEIKLIEIIDIDLKDFKDRAKNEHNKGMFDIAVTIYEEALLFLDSQENQFKHQISNLISKKCALWNNIAACYKQYQNSEKEIEFSSLVIANAEHLKHHQNILYKAYFRRGCAFEREEKYKKANKDIQYCREKNPYDLDVMKRLNHIKDALNHEKEEIKTRSLMPSHKLRKRLEEHKKDGNKFFGLQKYGKSQEDINMYIDQAIENFTKGIDLFRENKEVVKLEKDTELTKIAISLFTNRSLCYSKMKRDANVIADTTYVINNLSKMNIKAYYRRALSYKNFGQYKESLSDLNEILSIEPGNKDAQKELKVVKKLFEKELEKQIKKQQQKQKKTTKEDINVQQSKISKEVKVSEVKESEVKASKVKVTNPMTQKKRVKIDDETINKAAKIASKKIGRDKIQIPKTSYSFEADLNSLRKNEEELYSYISQLPPTTYSKIYKELEIQYDFFILILNILNKFETDSDRILNILYNFSLTENITMTVMFFNDEDRKVIETLLDKSKEATVENKEEMLRKAMSMIE